jgi:hypothetical protein
MNIRAEQKAKIEAREKAVKAKKELYKQIFLTDAGNSVLKDLAQFSQFGEDVFAMSPDDRTNAYNQGRQSILIHIKKILED